MIEQQPDDNHNPFFGLSQHLADHLQHEMWNELHELGEIQEIIHEMDGKAYRRVKRVKEHMMHCGDCLSEQIKTGMLIPLPDYWDMRKNAGGGRYPKLHYQVN